MKTVFVPIDFSPSAINALDFAITTADRLSAKLVLFHAFNIPTPVVDIPYKVLNAKIEAAKKDVEAKLIAECNKIQKSGSVPFGKIAFEYVAVEGPMPDALISYLENKHVDYIVMGTNLATHHTSGFFGSTASGVMAQAKCPVIIIPPYVHMGPELKKITFATNYYTTDVDAIAKLSVLAKAFNAQLNVLHVYNDTISTEEQISTMNFFMKAVNAETDYTNISFQILDGKNAEEKLKDYIIAGEDADIIVMSTHIRNWIQRLFEKSFTKQMALKSNVPMIILHHEEQEIMSED